MVNVGGQPILFHIMERYAKFGHKDFYLALGYKAEIIKEYFLNFSTLNSNFQVDLKNGEVNIKSHKGLDWKVTLLTQESVQ